MLTTLELQVPQVLTLWFWSHILLFWTCIGIMSLISSFETRHFTDVSFGKVIDMILMFLLLLSGATICEVSSLSATVAKHHGHIPVSLVFVSFYWCDVGHHSFILLSMILNHIG